MYNSHYRKSVSHLFTLQVLSFSNLDEKSNLGIVVKITVQLTNLTELPNVNEHFLTPLCQGQLIQGVCCDERQLIFSLC